MLWQQRSKKRWICLFPADVNPTGQGVDHRQVQRELGEVAVQLQDPSMLTTASIRVSWTVSGPLLKSRKGLLEGSVRIGELEMDSFIWSPSIFSFIFLNFPLFPSIYQGWPSVSVRPGLPSLLPTQWGILAPPGHQLTFRTQHSPHQPAQRNWVWNKDTALFRWIPGKRQPNVAGSNPRRRYQIWWLLKHVCSRKRFKADLS